MRAEGLAGTLRLACLSCLLFALPAVADVSERDKAWDALVAAAKAHGARETKLDRSSSFVFQREDGSYLTLTRMLETAKGRSVCLIAKGEMSTACVDWETGLLRLGIRKDAATPWKFVNFKSLEALEAAQPTMIDKLAWVAHYFISAFGSPDGECVRESKSGAYYRVPKVNCELDAARLLDR